MTKKRGEAIAGEKGDRKCGAGQGDGMGIGRLRKRSASAANPAV